MLKYLIIQLDDTSVSFCHYDNSCANRRLIPLDTLKKAIFWGMKENLTFQFLYPDYELPEEYKEVISHTYHGDIVGIGCEDKMLLDNADVTVLGISELPVLKEIAADRKPVAVVRGTLKEFMASVHPLAEVLPSLSRLNIVITDVESFSDSDVEAYRSFLASFSQKIKQEYERNHSIQVNILTDRMILDKMNNCGAGDESLTLCPDGKLYVCPAFYAEGDATEAVGSIDEGVDIKNPQLYKLEYAPICRGCDAWHCRRCIWLNRKTTLEVNTPGHEQCVMTHLERNASRDLLAEIRKIGTFLPDKEIPAINYLDPFDKIVTII